LITSGEGGVVVLESGDAPNLKTSLKNIIRAAVTNTEGNDGYQKFLTDRSVSSDLSILSLSILIASRGLACSDTIWTCFMTTFKEEGLRSWFLLYEIAKLSIQVC
jgi:hypothetical protein